MSFMNKNEIISFLYKQELKEFDTRKPSPIGNIKWYSSSRKKKDLLQKVKNAGKATKTVSMWIKLNMIG